VRVPDAPDPKLIDLLADRDVPCPGCRYNLRGLTTDRCPECNQQLELEIKLAEPKLAAFITGLVCISMGLGFCALLVVWVVVSLVIRRRGNTPPEFIIVAAGLIVACLLLALWLQGRRRLTRMSDVPRWALVALVSALGLAAPAIFLLTVR
jgi:hypothetical protein